MSLDGFKQKSNCADVVTQLVLAVGGSSAVTKVSGPGIAVTRSTTGLYLLTWSDPPGNFLGLTWGINATTPANVAAHTVVAGLYDASAGTLAVSVYNASNALHDLAALEWLTLCCFFSATSVNAA